jgi:hypothetical protein
LPSQGPILNITEVNYCKPYYCLSNVKLEIVNNDRLFFSLIFIGISRLICSPPFSILTIHYLTAAHYIFLNSLYNNKNVQQSKSEWSKAKRAESREQRAESREQRAESRSSKKCISFYLLYYAMPVLISK